MKGNRSFRLTALVAVLVGGVLLGGIAPVTAASTTDATQTASVDAAVSYQGDALTLAATSDQRVTGTTDLEPGTDVVVRVRSTSEDEVFVKAKHVAVADDGSFAISFDLTIVNATGGLPAEVVVLHDGTELTTANAIVKPPSQVTVTATPTPTATATPTPTAEPTETTSSSGAGFGAVVALVALSAAVLLGRRRV